MSRRVAQYARRGQYPETVAALKATLALMPAYPDVYNNLGLLCRKQGRRFRIDQSKKR